MSLTSHCVCSLAASGPWDWVFVVAFVVVAAIIAVGSYRSSRADQQRRGLVVDRLNSAGFLASDGDDWGVLGSLGHLPEFSRGRQALRWHAAAKDGSGLLAMEHRAVVGTGKSRKTILHTIAACPCPPGWPKLTLGPETLFTRLGEMLGWKDLKLDDEAFNSRWRVKSTAEDFAIVALSPQLQAWLGSAPASERWYIGNGWICCVWDGVASPELAVELCERPKQFAAKLPEELQAWREAPSSRRPI